VFRFHQEIEIRSTPKTLWRALTEPSGIESWFAPDVRVSPGNGGSIWVSWGPGMEGESRITAWELERRFAYSMENGSEEPNVTEFAIEAEADQCRLSVTQSGLANEEQLNAVAAPWGLFLHLLKHSCERPHTAAANVTVFRYYDAPADRIWSALQTSLAFRQIAANGNSVFQTGSGFLGLEFPNADITGIFCEQIGKRTALTIMSILYDPPVGMVDGVRTAWARVAGEIAMSPHSALSASGQG
jgi:uncharacterized protein YndB with AHSA1/START domain